MQIRFNFLSNHEVIYCSFKSNPSSNRVSYRNVAHICTCRISDHRNSTHYTVFSKILTLKKITSGSMSLCATEGVCSISFWLQHVLSSSVSVYGPPAAAPHASQAPAGPDLPATRPPATHPPLHLHPGLMFGPPLDPQVYSGCHYLSCHGEKSLAK